MSVGRETLCLSAHSAALRRMFLLRGETSVHPPSKPCFIFFLSSLTQSSDVYSLCVRGREGNYRCAAAATELAHPGESDDGDAVVASATSVN